MSPMAYNRAHTVGRLQRAGRWLLGLLVFLGALLLSLDAWLTRSWESLSVDEVLYHLRAPVAGTDPTVVLGYCVRYLPFVVLACLVIHLLFGVTARRGAAGTVVATLLTLALALGMGGGALCHFAGFVGLTDYLSMRDEDFIGAHYTDPTAVQITFPEHKRNVIYLYLESMELTFADRAHGGAFATNLIPELCTLAAEGDSFAGTDAKLNGALVLPGTDWTVGAMFGQSTGVPLKLPFYGNNMGYELSSFFPGLTAFGDILQAEGYQQQLLIGSDADFGARREFFLEHGGFDVYDYNRARQEGFIPADYHVFWGFEDEKLFAKARESLLAMAADGRPFNLTMLTVDTHFEDGYVCRLCGTEHGDNQYANVMSCSSRQVYDFVRWVQRQDFYADTAIVICGDHTTMDKDFCQYVPRSYQRRTYTAILNAAAQPQQADEPRAYSTLDLFPTTLAAMGVHIQGDRLGLGTNLYARRPTIVEQYGADECTASLSRLSEFLNGYSEAHVTQDLVNRAAAGSRLTYEEGDRGVVGFVLDNISLLNPGVVEGGRLEVWDDRTGASTSHDLEFWYENPNNTNVYCLVERTSFWPDDLAHQHAIAYVRGDGLGETAFAAWPEPLDELQARVADGSLAADTAQ